MWRCVLFSFLIGCLGVKGEVDCSNGRDCHSYMREVSGLPQTVEDFNRVCSHIIGYLECVIHHSNVCVEEIVPEATIHGSLAYLRDACDQTSETHEKIKKFLPCVVEHISIEDESCINRTTTVMSNYVSTQEISNDVVDNYCYYGTARLACAIVQVAEKCADGADDFALETLVRTKYINLVCEEDIKEKTLAVIEAAELNPSLKDRMKQLFQI